MEKMRLEVNYGKWNNKKGLYSFRNYSIYYLPQIIYSTSQISNLKSQILNLKSQILNLKS